MAIHYLDIDDEVTTAVARLRGSSEPHVGLVLPAGSHVATSRINFRLLAREAAARDLRLAIVAPETSVRAIAIAAGVPAYATVAAYEEALADETAQEARERRRAADVAFSGASGARAATDRGPSSADRARPPLERGRDQRPGSLVSSTGAETTPGPSGAGAARAGEPAPAGGAGAPDRARTGAGAVSSAGIVAGEAAARTAGGAAEPAAGGSRTGARSLGALPVAPRVHDEPRRRRRWALPLVLLLLLIVAAGGAGAYLLLPSATIVVTPVGVALGPIQLQVTADPTVTSVDAARLVIPAQQVPVPLTVDGTFPATGQKVDQVAAAGTVTFISNDTIDPVTIPAGTTVATDAGIQFLTSTTVVTPRATVSGTTITPGRASSGVTAVVPGPAGNVAAHAITVVSTRLQAFQVTADNAQATTGGSRTVTKIISKQDYDAAVKQLTTRITAQLSGAAASPPAAPSGATVIPGTATLGDVVTAPAPDGLVGVARASFQLTATATGTVLAVAEQPLDGLATSHLQADVPAGWSLFPDSVRTSVSDPTVEGGNVTFTVTAQGERWHPLDAAALLAQVRGRSVSDARTILQQYGEVSIATWPSYVTTIPTLDARVTLTVAPPKRAGS
jgi:hypothetical protein